MPRPSTPAANAASAQSREGDAPARAGRLRRGRARPDEHFVLGPRVLQGAVRHTYERCQDDPVYRPLRIYALDPSASVADGAQAVVNVPYEPLEATPRGLRGVNLEIVDDESVVEGGRAPVQLDDPFLLMRQGLTPSPEDPCFRQQMAYAVCSTTYAAFRQALGREVAWGFSRPGDGETGSRLRIRPCIRHLQNAYYESAKGEVRFGTFEASATVTGRNVPGGTVSLALSHDVVVHEMSHALLDGLRSHFLHPSNLDVLAFHEGFADLIALFQRFTYRDVVGRAVRASRGNLSASALLTDIAVQFAQAMNATGALRSALSGDERQRRYEDTLEPHARGEILVAAVFDAFNRVYGRKTAPLLRLSSGGTGVLPEGEIPELLAAQLTDQAGRLASQFLTICIRAIDYCPPVDITFGEFLRAVLTADRDVVPHDPWNYREAWIDAFAERRLYPPCVPSLSEDALLWKSPESGVPPEPQLSFAELRFDGDPGRVADRREMRRQAEAFGQLAADPAYRAEFGLAAADDLRLDGDTLDLPIVESVRSSRRVGPSGQVVFDLVAEITQRRRVRAKQAGEPGFDFFGGATVVLGPLGQVRYVIRKSVLDETRLEAQRRFIHGQGQTFFGKGPGGMLMPQASLLLALHDITRPQLRSSAGTRALVHGMTGTTERTAAQRYLLTRGESRPWVPLLKACLDACMAPTPNLGRSTVYDAPSEQAVNRLQMAEKAVVDGIVGPATWAIVGRRLREKGALPAHLGAAPRWIAGLLKNDPAATGLSRLDLDGVIDMTAYSFGALTPTQQAGLKDLLGALVEDADLTDLRWGAYMLATVKHECANTWRPIEEFGKGAGRAYGRPVTVPDESGRPVRNIYYGRGFVQLTWRENYLAVGQALGQGRSLEIHPERALDPALAYRVMSHGMRKGIFTGHTLARHINANGADYLNARRIINGLDRAELIKGYAQRFETMLLSRS